MNILKNKRRNYKTGINKRIQISNRLSERRSVLKKIVYIRCNAVRSNKDHAHFYTRRNKYTNYAAKLKWVEHFSVLCEGNYVLWMCPMRECIRVYFVFFTQQLSKLSKSMAFLFFSNLLHTSQHSGVPNVDANVAKAHLNFLAKKFAFSNGKIYVNSFFFCFEINLQHKFVHLCFLERVSAGFESFFFVAWLAQWFSNTLNRIDWNKRSKFKHEFYVCYLLVNAGQ